LIDGNMPFSDRTYPFINTPTWLAGTEYVRTFNSDKDGGGSGVNYAVTLSEAATIFVTADDRLGGSIQDRIDAVAGFAAAGTFTDTGYDLFIHESDTMDRPMSMFAAPLAVGTYDFGPSEGNNFYQIGVMLDAPPPPVEPQQTLAFTYSTVTGTGTISGTLDARDADGPAELYFEAPMPAPDIVDPNPGMTPAGAVGTITEPSGDDNVDGKTVGIDWTGKGPVTLTATHEGKEYSVEVDLLFGPSGDSWSSDDDPLSSYDPFGENFDYEWLVKISDDALAEHGGDAVSPGDGDNPRMAIYYGVGTEDPNGLAHRLTQNEEQFNVGPDAYENTDNTKGDGGRWSKYAAYQSLGLYYGWRDKDPIGGGSFQVDSIEFSGNLLVDSSAIVPEPSTFVLAAMALLGLGFYRRRKRS